MEERQGTYKGIIEGLRSHGLRDLVREIAFRLNLEDHSTESKGWVRTTVYVNVRGSESKLRSFKQVLNQSLER